MTTAIATCLISDNPLLSAILPDYFHSGAPVALRATPEGCDVLLLDAGTALPTLPHPAPPVILLGEGADIPAARKLRKPLQLPKLREAIESVASMPVFHALGPQYRFLPATRRIAHVNEGDSLTLTEKETIILSSLCAATEAIPRDTLLHQVWGYGGDIDTRTLETHIHRLRQKLERFSNGCLSIRGENGGYHLAI
ncbi:MAG: winged-helix domain-containing protein [Alphaproteobacteria bacterium]|nr:winged-helix domain-containing protein [Alphaproteobacteria bacterium]